MAVRPNTAARNGVLDDGLDHFDGATATIYTGTQPSTGGGAHSDTELASGTIPTPAFAAASSGGRGPASNWTLDVSDTGTAGWMRITQSGAIIDMSVGESTGDLSLDETALTNGGIVRVTGGAVTLPGNDA